MDNDDKTGFKYRPNDSFDDGAQSDLLVSADSQPVMAHESDSAPDNQIEWIALEFEERPKGFVWYVYLAVVVVAISAAVYLVSEDRLATGLVIAVGLLFGFSASRKPRKLNYKLSSSGISISERIRRFISFKAFWLDLDSETPSFSLLPLKRFVPTLKIYFDIADVERIGHILSDNLPLSEPRLDLIDKFLQKIRF